MPSSRETNQPWTARERGEAVRREWVKGVKTTLRWLGAAGVDSGHPYAPEVADELCATLDRVLAIVDAETGRNVPAPVWSEPPRSRPAPERLGRRRWVTLEPRHPRGPRED